MLLGPITLIRCPSQARDAANIEDSERVFQTYLYILRMLSDQKYTYITGGVRAKRAPENDLHTLKLRDSALTLHLRGCRYASLNPRNALLRHLLGHTISFILQLMITTLK